MNPASSTLTLEMTNQYLQKHETIMELLRGANLSLQPKKCHFGFNQVDYLGHVMSGKGVVTDLKKYKLFKDSWDLKTSL